MNDILFVIPGFNIQITAWKLVGYTGVLMFGGRWFVQMVASHVTKRPVMPRTFWYMSIVGSALLLAYFIFGKNDSVGVFSNLFPLGVAIYNLYLDFKHRRSLQQANAVV